MKHDTLADSHPYTLDGIRQMLGLSRHAIGSLIELGFVRPERGPRRSWRFSFRDVVLLRSAHDLQQAQIPTRRIVRSLKRLKAALPDTMPLSGLRISAVGDEIAVRRTDAPDDGTWSAGSGQRLMDFGVEASSGTVAFLPVERDAPQATTVDSPDALFERAESLEAVDADEAEALYRQVLAVAPEHVGAYLNLGWLLCEGGRCEEAVALSDAALAHCADEPLVHYNRAVALEDLGRKREALASYEEAIARNPALADAHHNAALLYQELGVAQRAIRHFSAWRRLAREE